MITQRELTEQLSKLGLLHGELVMVHASLRKLGPVEGGAQGVIHSILKAIGEEGTLVMPLGSKTDDVFNANESPSDPEIGVLAEQFRQFPGSFKNDHAASRFCAYGPRAKELLSNPPLHDYYDKGSPLHRFTEANGKILRLRANIDTTTITHFAEYLANVSPKRRVQRRYVRADIGEQWIESLDDSEGIQDWPHGDYFEKILLDFFAEGNLKVGNIGSCNAEYFEAKIFVPYAVKWMEQHLASR